ASLQKQQAALVPVAEGMRELGQTLGRLREDEGELLRLQQLVQQNLVALAATGSFEQALHSLTAAVHLLTARVPGGVAAAGYLGKAPRSEAAGEPSPVSPPVATGALGEAPGPPHATKAAATGPLPVPGGPALHHGLAHPGADGPRPPGPSGGARPRRGGVGQGRKGESRPPQPP